MRHETLRFRSGDAMLAGDLFLPGGEALGAVVTTGPLTSVKEQAAGAYARALAARGYAALAFDHSHWGESGGEPRQLEDPMRKASDIRAALDALESHEALQDLPLHGVGICAGGGYMARAVAGDGRFASFAGVAGVYPDARQTRAWMGNRFEAAMARAKAAERRWQDEGIAETIPAVAEEEGSDVAMPLAEAFRYYGTPRGAVENYTNAFAIQSRARTLTFDVQSDASRIAAPTLLVHSEKALAPALARRFFAALTGPKREVWLPSGGQIDFYDDPGLIGAAADHIAAFFRDRRPDKGSRPGSG